MARVNKLRIEQNSACMWIQPTNPGNMKPGGEVLADPKTTNVQQHFSLMVTVAEVCAVTTEGSKNPFLSLNA